METYFIQLYIFLCLFLLSIVGFISYLSGKIKQLSKDSDKFVKKDEFYKHLRDGLSQSYMSDNIFVRIPLPAKDGKFVERIQINRFLNILLDKLDIELEVTERKIEIVDK